MPLTMAKPSRAGDQLAAGILGSSLPVAGLPEPFAGSRQLGGQVEKLRRPARRFDVRAQQPDHADASRPGRDENDLNLITRHRLAPTGTRRPTR
jgi:hypothetical protein